jgi:DNA repair protein RecN (Recombination protein N)
MLKHLSLQNFVIVTSLALEVPSGFVVLTGETGAGKSILIDAVQLVLGGRGDAGVVREGTERAEISAEFDTPMSLHGWLQEAGFECTSTLLLRRVIDIQGKSRAWINGSAATLAQLREAAEHLVDIHGQHAWQSLTRSESVRQLLDAYGGVNVTTLSTAWSQWRTATQALSQVQLQQAGLEQDRQRLAWQVGEVEKLAPQETEWPTLNAEHQRLSNAQALIEAAHTALETLHEHDTSAYALTTRACDALQAVVHFDTRLAQVCQVLHSASAQLQDSAHTLSSYLNQTEPDPQQLAQLDERLASWISLARRYRLSPEQLPTQWAQWQSQLQQLNAATDLQTLQATADTAHANWTEQAKKISHLRQQTAPALSKTITQTLQQLGMQGGVFEVELLAQTAPQSFGLESAQFLVAGHAGSTPRPLAKVASGGELSRIALAIAVSTHALGEAQVGAPPARPATLIFDEVDAGVGGTVADTVGRLMKRLGAEHQVLCVTHLPQVAACADHHFVVAKIAEQGHTHSTITAVTHEERVSEVSRMLGGQRLSQTSTAHAQEMLSIGTCKNEAAAASIPSAAAATPKKSPKRPVT